MSVAHILNNSQNYFPEYSENIGLLILQYGNSHHVTQSCSSPWFLIRLLCDSTLISQVKNTNKKHRKTSHHGISGMSQYVTLSIFLCPHKESTISFLMCSKLFQCKFKLAEKLQDLDKELPFPALRSWKYWRSAHFFSGQCWIHYLFTPINIYIPRPISLSVSFYLSIHPSTHHLTFLLNLGE